MLTLEEPCLDSRLTVQARWAGPDLWILVTGGHRPHVGSVSFGIPRPSLSGDGTASATVSTLNATGHKDDEVGNRFARFLAARLGCRVSVSCGVHFDAASPADLEEILRCADRLRRFLGDRLAQQRPASHRSEKAPAAPADDRIPDHP
ncbi:MAG: proteasome assembly chaperone 4 family protein [Planctomycetes bacterium]|nr:proteasome assembly chaperone 4 family protein [Planctomycetota bacterium]